MCKLVMYVLMSCTNCLYSKLLLGKLIKFDMSFRYNKGAMEPV